MGMWFIAQKQTSAWPLLLQGVRESCRGHWKTLNQLNFYWSQMRNGIADTIAAQPQLQGGVPSCVKSLMLRIRLPIAKWSACQLAGRCNHVPRKTGCCLVLRACKTCIQNVFNRPCA